MLLWLALQTVTGEAFDVYGGKEAAAGRSKQAEAAAGRFAAVFGPAPRGSIVLTKDKKLGGSINLEGYKTWTFPWPETLDGPDPFEHELGHILFVQVVNAGCAEKLKKGFKGYGSYLPDWLDEGAALACEPDAARAEFLKALDLEKPIAFASFFSMEHPLKDAPAGHMKPAVADEAARFYAQSLSVVEFMADQYGRGYVRHLVATLQDGGGVADTLPWLEKHRDALPGKPDGVPETIDGLQAFWLSWASSRK